MAFQISFPDSALRTLRREVMMGLGRRKFGPLVCGRVNELHRDVSGI